MSCLWLVQVITDLERFCHANGLDELGSRLSDARTVAVQSTRRESDKPDELLAQSQK